MGSIPIVEEIDLDEQRFEVVAGDLVIAPRLDRQAFREIAPVQVGEKLGRQGVAFHDRPLGIDDALLTQNPR